MKNQVSRHEREEIAGCALAHAQYKIGQNQRRTTGGTLRVLKLYWIHNCQIF